MPGRRVNPLRAGIHPACRILNLKPGSVIGLWQKGKIPRNEDGSWNLAEIRMAYEKICHPDILADLPPNPYAPKTARASSASGATVDDHGRITIPLEDGAIADPDKLPSYALVKTKREIARLREAELDLAERQRDLMPVEDARKAWGNMIIAIQSRLLLLPAKLAPRVAVMTDPAAIQYAIDRDIRMVMEELSKFDPVASVLEMTA